MAEGRRHGWVLWAVVAAALAVYLVMVLWSLPRIATDAGGLAPFDMRPFGYSADEARGFLGALSDGGRRFYADVQHRLDLLYPALLALAVSLGALRLFGSRLLRTLVIGCAVGGMAFDHAENWLVGQMLVMAPADVPERTIALASTATLAKSVLTTLALTAILGGVVMMAVRRFRQ